jgi:hypothetical protein
MILPIAKYPGIFYTKSAAIGGRRKGEVGGIYTPTQVTFLFRKH